MFANNKNLKNTSKIYVDLEYYEELENINKQNIQEIERMNEILIWKQEHEEQLQKEIKELKEIIDIFQEKININLKGNDKKWK